MKTLKILEVPIEERIFVIPLDLQSHDALLEIPNVVDLMRLRLLAHTVDRFLDDEIHLSPATSRKSTTQPLSSFGLAAARSDNFFDRNRHVAKDRLQLGDSVRKVYRKNCLGVRMEFDLKPLVDEWLEHDKLPGDLRGGSNRRS
jgi:hypothetical protein